jgi:hypothetical protein
MIFPHSKKTLHAFGDSFVLGDQDDFIHDKIPGVVITHKMNFPERVEYLRKNVSFASLVAKKLDYNYNNYAERGSGSYPQLDKMWSKLMDGTIKENDIILFGITTICRDRSSAHKFEESVNPSFAERIADRIMLTTSDFRELWEADYFYILSILTTLENSFNVKIIKFNLFNNPLDISKDEVKQRFNFDILGRNFNGNTLIDILNDTWGSNNKHPYHTELDVPLGYEHLYTIKKHPSIKGHKKIAEWFLSNIQL